MTNKPELIIVAGANGSGKTTFAEEYITLNDALYIGADAIAYELCPEDVVSVRVKAGRLFIQRIKEAISRKENLIVESTLSGITFQRIIDFAIDNGYAISILYLFLTDIEACVNRVKERVLKGGHDVPYHDIIRRYSRSNSNFWNHYRKLVDRWHVFQNTNEEFSEIVWGDKVLYDIIDEELFSVYLKSVDGDENGQ